MGDPQKKIIIWTDRISEMNTKGSIVGGLTVQMALWAEVFLDNDWDVYSFSRNRRVKKFNKINFLFIPQLNKLGFILEFFFNMFYLIKIRPEIVIVRGAGRRLFYAAVLSRLFKIKLIHFGASDVNYLKGGERFSKYKVEVICYRKGVQLTNCFVAQNEYQKSLLAEHYNKKNIIVIPNIWKQQMQQKKEKEFDAIWVANFRELKRPEWFLQLAKDFSLYKFAMVGGPLDKQYYDKIENQTKTIKNLTFFGKKTLDEVNDLFSMSKCLICTSIFEGFPNTFLQAWANGIPIISTVDPSDILKREELGFQALNYIDLSTRFGELINNNTVYKKIQMNICSYFKTHHDPFLHYQTLYEKLIK